MINYVNRPHKKFPHVLQIPYLRDQNNWDSVMSFINSEQWLRYGKFELTKDLQDWIDETVGIELIHYHIIKGSTYFEFRFLEKDKANQFKLIWGI